MRAKLIYILKKFPLAYRLTKICYWQTKAWHALILGTPAQEKYWQKRHLTKRGDWDDNREWVMGYWHSQNHPHRDFLIKKISAYMPNSALEIGSNCGPNLFLLAKKFPQAKLMGIDINQKAINVGRKLLQQQDVSNVKLILNKADAIRHLPDKSFDIVFTDAVLIYIGPDKIKKLTQEMLRLARKAVIFLEWHQELKNRDAQGLGIYYFGHWKRNYKNLLKQLLPEEKIHLTKIPPLLWPGRNWSQLGYLIEATII